MATPHDPYSEPFALRTMNFAVRLAERGHRVEVFHRVVPLGGRKIIEQEPPGIELRPLTARSLPEFWRSVREADVVHFQKSHPFTAATSLMFGRIANKPMHQDWDDNETAFRLQAVADALHAPGISIGRRGVEFLAWSARLTLGGLAERSIPLLVDTIGGASIELRRLSRQWGSDPSAIFPARVGVDSTVFRPEARDDALRSSLGLSGPTVLFAGTFGVYPELMFLVQSLKRLFEKAPGVQCLFVGAGSLRRSLEQLLTDNSMRQRVVMTEGYVPFREMPRYVASCDLAALPFLDSPIHRAKSSLTLMEVMASGVPAVTHPVGDMPWILGGTGVLVRGASPEEFGDELAALALDEPRRRKLGLAARARAVSSLGWNETVDFLEKAYYAAIDRHAHKGKR